jgi:hypothetical protein
MRGGHAVVRGSLADAEPGIGRQLVCTVILPCWCFFFEDC